MSNLIASEGLGLDAVSEGELLTALKGGVPNEKIVFMGIINQTKRLNLQFEETSSSDNNHDLNRLENISNSLNEDLEIMIIYSRNRVSYS